MITFEVLETYQSKVDTQVLEKAIMGVFEQQFAPSETDMTFVISDDEQLRSLNYQYRDIDAPTDVLSFPADFNDPENNRPYLGDVVVSLPRAEFQAEEGGHSLMAELQLLAVHGVLHLLGYDHLEDEEKAQMWAAQREILYQLGLENIKISGDS